MNRTVHVREGLNEAQEPRIVIRVDGKVILDAKVATRHPAMGLSTQAIAGLVHHHLKRQTRRQG